MDVRCWEFNKCGHEPGGVNSASGVCPSYNAVVSKGTVCWSVTGTLCHGGIQKEFTHKLDVCLKCPYFAKNVSERTHNQGFLGSLFSADEAPK